ncbi:MAG: PolC-type DNA polymerase III [Clostridia bacterium]|nr:PolC-type DNA polymerase III [Clostridia bacterium]
MTDRMQTENTSFYEIAAQCGLDAGVLGLKVADAVFDVQKKTMTVTAEVADAVSDQITAKIASALERQVPGIRVEVLWQVREKMPYDAALLRRYREEMIEYCNAAARCRRVLETAQWQFDSKGNLTLIPTLPDAHVILESSRCAELLKVWIDHRFSGFREVLIAEAQTEEEPDFESIAAEVVRKAEAEAAKKRKKKKEGPKILLGTKVTEAKTIPIEEINEGSGTVVVEGTVFEVEDRETRGGRIEIKFAMTDYDSSCTVKCYVNKEEKDALLKGIAPGMQLRVRGDCGYDRFEKGCVVVAHDITAPVVKPRKDDAPVKRVELHLHTKMSNMDAVTDVKALFKRAKEWGMDAVAVTDHGVIQAFPDAYAAAKQTGVRFLAGTEAYMVDDLPDEGDEKKFPLDGRYCVFDIETTGLNAGKDTIIEIGAAIVENGKIGERYNTFVNPYRKIPEKIVKLTGISDSMVKDAPPIEKVLPEFLTFAGASVLVAHNAAFDTEFIATACKRMGIDYRFESLDTLTFARQLVPELKNYKLNSLTKYFNVDLENHHRAVDDALACAQIMLHLFGMLRDMGISYAGDVRSHIDTERIVSSQESHHTVIFARDQEGLRNLYELITESHLRYFYRRPRMPKSRVQALREGLIIGSACENGELYTAVRTGKSEEELLRIASFYDYLEIQPDGNNMFLVREGKVASAEELHRFNRTIVRIGEQLGKPVVATGDVHYLDRHDGYFREILQHSQGYEDVGADGRPLYFRTTQEMLEEFSYLGEETARKVVIDDTRKVASWISSIVPIPEGLHPPVIEGSDEQIREMAWKRCREMYGDPVPEIVYKRLDRELNSIISNDYAVLYLIAQKLVTKSLSDGYLVGSRGSVGSSLAATMCSITEVNPLPPHYRCEVCRFSDFDVDTETYAVGPDLPERVCPVCGAPLVRDGYDIPFETFLGFKGDKVPDIDLNFSGEYQPVAHRYTEEIFGKGQVFRAGTVGTVADRTVFAYVRDYLEDKGKTASPAEIRRLIAGCSGIKRTTGQHPGGIVVLPKGEDINRFTPLQHPADDPRTDIITSHFEFSDMHDTLVKLDILGHVDPTVIRMLEDMTGVNARKVPITDPKVISLFSSTEALGVTEEQIGTPVGTYGLPEFGTPFVRQMLVETKPTSMSELIRISGLSHGTDVWIGNAQDLIKNGTVTLREAICTRDDIMNALIKKMEPLDAFNIMESVRKGKGLVLKGKGDMEPKMRDAGVEDWFIDSCKKIGYMFPKAHASAYVMMCLRIAWFKIYEPQAYYATYFTARTGTDFDASVMLKSDEEVRSVLRDYSRRGKLNPREKSIQAALEVIVEMHARKINFLPIDLYESEATRFTVAPDGIRPPLTAIPGLGESVAKAIVAGRDRNDPFRSVDDFTERTKTGRSMTALLRDYGVLDGLPESSQMNLFEGLGL